MKTWKVTVQDRGKLSAIEVTADIATPTANGDLAFFSRDGEKQTLVRCFASAIWCEVELKPETIVKV